MDILQDKSLSCLIEKLNGNNKDNFPYINHSNCRITSPQDDKYNCIAWGGGDKNHWWCPKRYWLENIPRVPSMSNLIKIFEKLGYKICNNCHLEDGITKIVLYCTEDNMPTHVAIQLKTGKWSSKLGALEDIEHDTPKVLEGKTYGQARIFMYKTF
ncbi:MAG: hypothetical protein OXF49_00795 [Candidatus Saccharibacteria bacterium]|nr:hypothetical protein [Candidatus Saccharibacteria bacterium]